jgi:adenosylcobinamide-phosphate synthase
MQISWSAGAASGADPALVLLLALALDAAIGDPAWLYRAIPHPVALLGKLIERGERRLNHPGRGRRLAIGLGCMFTLALVALAWGAGWIVASGFGNVAGGWIGEAAVASMLIAFRGLYNHVAAVARGLEESLDAGRAAVARIVGRDPDSLDAAGVARAAAESTAENFSDGVAAPVFWYLLLGLPGLCAYKAVNTLDSMIGHRDARFEAFGKFAARLDDLVNWAPARLAGLLFVAAAAVLPGASAGRAWRSMWRDARKHRSLNAGWQEAALAGALGFALAGPRHYGQGPVEDAWMGDGRAELTAGDLRAVLRLYIAATALLALLLAIGVLV